jgi:hypothetical protein
MPPPPQGKFIEAFEEILVKRLSYCALILALLSVPAFAAKNSQTVNFADAVKVGATQLPAGEYKVTWDGTGSNVQVTLEQKGVQHPATATVAAKVVEQKNPRSGFIINTTGGANIVETLQFTKFNVVFEGAPAQGQ